MFTKSFALLFAATTALSVSGLSIDTPAELTQCGTVELKWSGKKSPFILSVLPSCGSDSEDPLMEFTGVNATSYKWTVNLPSSTGPIAFAIIDREGNEAYTEEVVIKASEDATCLSTATSSSAVNGAAATTSDADSLTRTTVLVSSTPTPSAPVNAGAGLNSGSNSGTGGSSSSSNETQTQANGAIAPAVSAFTGVIGIAAAFFVLL